MRQSRYAPSFARPHTSTCPEWAMIGLTSTTRTNFSHVDTMNGAADMHVYFVRELRNIERSIILELCIKNSRYVPISWPADRRMHK